MISLILILLGFCALALSMHRHAGHVGLKPPVWRPMPFRLAGWLLLGLSLVLCFVHPDWPIALVGWVGSCSLAAAVVTFTITYYRPLRWPKISIRRKHQSQ